MTLTKIWALIKLLKGGTYDKVVDALLPLLLEHKPFKDFLDGKKTAIGYVLILLSFGLEQAQMVWPQPWMPVAIQIIGLLMAGIGIADRGRKARSQ